MQVQVLNAAIVPGAVILIGPPGIGKGTQAKRLMTMFEIPQISTGDLLRDNRARHTKIGLAADELMNTGQLVPDDLVNRMVAARLENPDCERGYILDGFPRTSQQAQWLDGFMADRGPALAINLVGNREELLRRITGRRICPEGHIYNVFSAPPAVDGICDIDGGALSQRKDDTEEVFNERMRVFDEQTAPIIPHYRANGDYAEIDGLADVETVSEAILSQLINRRSARPGLSGVR